MEDSNKTLPSCSSPKRSSPGNNENVSESQRNSHFNSKSKHFMSPTISAAIKHTTPKKNILKEPKSDAPKLGNRNSFPRNSLPKTPSPKNVIPSDDVGTFLDDSCAIPYDPLTNYLSPRPRFRRYRPHQSRELVEESESSDSEISFSQDNEEDDEVVEDQENVVEEDYDDEIEEVLGEGNWGLKWVLLKWVFVISAVFLCSLCICYMKSDSTVVGMISTQPIETVRPEIKGLKLEVDDFDYLNFRSVSLGRVHSGVLVNHGSVTLDGGQIVESGGNLIENDQRSNGTEVYHTVIEESNKWLDEFYRMRSQFWDARRLIHRPYNSSITEAATESLQENDSYVDPKAEKEPVEGEESVGDSEWAIVKNVDDSESKKGDLDSDSYVEGEESVDDCEWATVKNVDDSESEKCDLDSDTYVAKDVKSVDDSEGATVENVDDSEFKKGNLDSEHIEGPNVEVSEFKKNDLDWNSAIGAHEIEVERDPESSSEASDMENDVENVTEVEKTVDVSEATSEREKAADKPELVADNEQPKFDDKELETVSSETASYKPEVVADNEKPKFDEKVSETVPINAGYRQLKLYQKDVRFFCYLQVSVGLVIVGFLVRKVCCKRVKTFLGTRSSNSRLLPTQAKFLAKGRKELAAKTVEKSVQASNVYQGREGLATKTGEKSVQASNVYQGRLGLANKTGKLSVQASKVYHEEMNPPSSSVSVPIEEERIEENPLRRVIPVVKQTGELEFTSLTMSCSVKSEMSKKDEAIISGPVEVMALQTGASLSGRATTVQPSCSEVSTADSQSYGSEYSSKKDRKRDVSKVMSTPIRRSNRLQNKAATSPRS